MSQLFLMYDGHVVYLRCKSSVGTYYRWTQ